MYQKSNKLPPKCRFYRPDNPTLCRNGEDCPFRHGPVVAEHPGSIATGARRSTNETQRTMDAAGHITATFEKLATPQTVNYTKTISFDPKYKYVKKKVDDESTPKSSGTPIATHNAKSQGIRTNSEFNQITMPTDSMTRMFTKSSEVEKLPGLSSVSKDNPKIYSKKENLAPADISAFESSEFSIGAVPLLPPPSCLA